MIGLGAGLIGAVHRYFLGRLTQIPCSLATVIAGLAAGMIYKRCKGEFINIWRAALFAIVIESLHMGPDTSNCSPLYRSPASSQAN